MDGKKQSGRTTRMMHHAVSAARAGRAVYVCFDKKAQCQEWERWRAWNYPKATSIQFDVPEHLDIDWYRMALLGAHPNCLLLVDHYVIEKQFAVMLKMLHNYDSTGTTS